MPSDVCSVDCCLKHRRSAGLCNRHYLRRRAGGDPEAPTLHETRTAHADDVVYLVAAGTSVDEALQRVGWTPTAAYRWALRHRHEPLRAAIARVATRSRRPAS